jgi:hypothetical protein
MSTNRAIFRLRSVIGLLAMITPRLNKITMTAYPATSPRLWTSTPIQGSQLPEAEDINRRILAAFQALDAVDFSSRTHFFGGRFENLYLERQRIPELDRVLGYAESCARAILNYGHKPLRLGFWFNAQGPGQGTSIHNHDENDELLSGVYYIQVPEKSGEIVLLDGQLTTRLMPKAGHFLFFPPSLPHRVEVNQSQEQRLSLAFNLGPLAPA